MSDISDIIAEILEDHRELEDYYAKFKAAQTEEEGLKWFNLFVWEISRHSIAEEIVLYSLLEQHGEEGKQLMLKSREDHRKMKEDLEDLRHEKDPKKFDEKFDLLFKDLQDHFKTEEGKDLPFIKEKLTEEQLLKAGKTFDLRKKIAPTRPHPTMPDRPAALEQALGLFVTPIDKLRDMFTDFPNKETTNEA